MGRVGIIREGRVCGIFIVFIVFEFSCECIVCVGFLCDGVVVELGGGSCLF